MTSPGREKPVNFDYVRQDVLRRDPGIVQPVALRLSDSPVDPQQPQESLPDGGAVSLVSVTAVDQSSDLDETEDERAKRAEQLGRPSGQKQPKGMTPLITIFYRIKIPDLQPIARPIRLRPIPIALVFHT